MSASQKTSIDKENKAVLGGLKRRAGSTRQLVTDTERRRHLGLSFTEAVRSREARHHPWAPPIWGQTGKGRAEVKRTVSAVCAVIFLRCPPVRVRPCGVGGGSILRRGLKIIV